MSVWFLFPCAVFLAALLTGGIRRYAISRSLIVCVRPTPLPVPGAKGDGVHLI